MLTFRFMSDKAFVQFYAWCRCCDMIVCLCVGLNEVMCVGFILLSFLALPNPKRMGINGRLLETYFMYALILCCLSKAFVNFSAPFSSLKYSSKNFN